MDDAITMFGFIHIFFIFYSYLYTSNFFFLDTELSKEDLMLLKVKFTMLLQINTKSYFTNQTLHSAG